MRFDIRPNDGYCSYTRVIKEWDGSRKLSTCEARCDLVVATDLPHGRPDVDAAFCPEHGGVEAAKAQLLRDWYVQAPASVGGPAEVMEAGTTNLDSRHVYVVLRHNPKHPVDKWNGYIGIGSYTTPVARGQGFEEVRAATLKAWRDNRDRRVEEIRRMRGGTLSWGEPVNPREEPEVLVLGTGKSAWDALSEARHA